MRRVLVLCDRSVAGASTDAGQRFFSTWTQWTSCKSAAIAESDFDCDDDDMVNQISSKEIAQMLKVRLRVQFPSSCWTVDLFAVCDCVHNLDAFHGAEAFAFASAGVEVQRSPEVHFNGGAAYPPRLKERPTSLS
eukprot:5582626-Pleurochrysis_carterae.AAC.1